MIPNTLPGAHIEVMVGKKGRKEIYQRFPVIGWVQVGLSFDSIVLGPTGPVAGKHLVNSRAARYVTGGDNEVNAEA
jgi:hypothetical protein